MNTVNVKKDTISSTCPISRRCGGCRHKNTPYASTLRAKQSALIKLLSRYGRVEKIIGAPSPFHYRNKVQGMMGLSGGKCVSGVYQASERKLIATDRCMLSDERADAIICCVRDMAHKFGISPYDVRSGRGELRHVLVRVAIGTGEIMVVLVTERGEVKNLRSLANELCRRHTEITTVVHNINDTTTPLLLGDESHVLYGEGYITDKLCGLSFRISPRSFYQINHDGAELLYEKAIELATLRGGERVFDAYCGTGTIGLCAAGRAHKVIGVEINEDAVCDARENARLNGIENASFICGDAARAMTQMSERGERIDVVITDPPRAGCSREFLASLIKLSPRRVIYVSCNPETLSRDLGMLTKNGYAVDVIQGVDMFPFTEHCECLVSLTCQRN